MFEYPALYTLSLSNDSSVLRLVCDTLTRFDNRRLDTYFWLFLRSVSGDRHRSQSLRLTKCIHFDVNELELSSLLALYYLLLYFLKRRNLFFEWFCRFSHT